MNRPPTFKGHRPPTPQHCTRLQKHYVRLGPERLRDLDTFVYNTQRQQAGPRHYTRQISSHGAVKPFSVPLQGMSTPLTLCISCHVQRLMAQWYDDSDIAPVRRLGRPRSAQWINACCMIAEKVARDPVQTVMDLSRESGISRMTGGRVVKELACSHTHVRGNKNCLLERRSSSWSEQEDWCDASEIPWDL